MSYGHGYGQQGQGNFGYGSQQQNNWGGTYGAAEVQGSSYHDQPQSYHQTPTHGGGLDPAGLPVIPAMSATFVPGGDDDWTMPAPELISPSPQRIMPEVPTNIADSIGTLEKTIAAELAALETPAMAPPAHRRETIREPLREPLDEPTFSPFPKLRNPGPNIPPTDEDKERYLEAARLAVLASDDPETQLAWAQDSLNFVDTSLQYLARTSEDGTRPHTPAVEHQLRTDALNIVNFLADQHHPKAEFMRGTWLEFGKLGFRVDRREAFRSYARAAERGQSRAEYRMGMQYENSNEPMKAIKHYTQGAALGDSASNYRLGMMTLLGQHGQTQDFGRGVMLVRQAAETADENAPQGAYVYGLMLARDLPGLSIPEIYLSLDIAGAKVMIEKAAFLGFAKAQVKMGQAYELCQLGCQFDPALSLHYNALASKQGEPEADMAISKWFLCGHESVFPKNEELAFKYAKQAAKAGLPTAEFAMGYFYEIGMYVPANLAEAQTWYALAASHGNKDAQGRLDGISRSKTLSKKDHEAVALSKIRASRSVRIPNRPMSTAVDMPNPMIPPVPAVPAHIPIAGTPIPPAGTPIPPAGMPMGHLQYPGVNVNARPTSPGFINPAVGVIQPFGADAGPLPPRTSSVAPYPQSPTSANMPTFNQPGRPATSLGQTTRPMSAAPMGGPMGGPLVRPQTTVPSGVLVPAGMYPPQGGRGGPVQRPSSAFPGAAPNNGGPGFPQSQPLRPLSQNKPLPQQAGGIPYPGFEAPLPQPKVDKPAARPNPNDKLRKPSIVPQSQPTAAPVGPRPSPTPKPQVPVQHPVSSTPKPKPAPFKQPLPQPQVQALPPQPQVKPIPPPQMQTKPSAISQPSGDTPAPPKSPTTGGSGKKRFEEYDWLPPPQKEQECAIM